MKKFYLHFHKNEQFSLVKLKKKNLYFQFTSCFYNQFLYFEGVPTNEEKMRQMVQFMQKEKEIIQKENFLQGVQTVEDKVKEMPHLAPLAQQILAKQNILQVIIIFKIFFNK